MPTVMLPYAVLRPFRFRIGRRTGFRGVVLTNSLGEVFLTNEGKVLIRP